MEQYICPLCGTDMNRSEIRKQPNLICPKCNFMILKRHYDFIYDLGKYGVAKLPPKEKDKDKREMSVPEMIFHAKNGDETPEDAYIPEYAAEKPPLGCAANCERRMNYMELLKLESANDDKTIYLNPAYLESFIDGDDGCCHVYVNGDSVTPYKVRMKAEDLAAIVARVKVPSRYPFGSGGF